MLRYLLAWLFTLQALASISAQTPNTKVISSVFHADIPFPQYAYLWQEGWSLKDDSGNTLVYARPDMPLGGYLFIYFRNTTDKPIVVKDLTVEGIKLSEGIGVTHTPKNPEEKFGASILLSKLPKESIDVLMQAGAPVWWKPEPREVPAGGMAEIVIRLKRKPSLSRINVSIITDHEPISTSISVSQEQPRFSTIAFSPDLKTVYLYARHPQPGIRPERLFLDGVDVTKQAVIAADPCTNVAPIVLNLSAPLKWMSYHNFQATYPDGSSAVAGIRAQGREMVYGMWGAGFVSGEPREAARTFLADWATHNINVLMGHISGNAGDYIKTDEGWDLAESMGFGRMTTWDTGKHKPVYFFLQDEPDAHDVATDELKPADRLGSLGLWLVRWQEVLRDHDPDVPILLNIDNTYKPENWYMYHQLSDIPCVDPYFPEQQDYVYNKHPGALSSHTKPTYVQAVTTISQSSCQPKPLHVILCSTRYRDGKGYEGRFPTPEEKRMEVYYAIACGAKALSYWWFSPDTYCVGLGKDEPAAHALWKEIGLLGAEVRTAGPIITVSSPADIPLEAPRLLWVKTLLSGTDTLSVITVNEDVACDRVGTVFKPVQDASVIVTLPAWLKVADVFEINYDGLKDVQWKKEDGKLVLNLGTVNISRFVVVTSDPGLRQSLQRRYNDLFARNVAALLKNN